MSLDVNTIGRASVDLYGAQVGGCLQDMRSFDKYIGGSPTNLVTAAAWLELKSALITLAGRFPRDIRFSDGCVVASLLFLVIRKVGLNSKRY